MTETKTARKRAMKMNMGIVGRIVSMVLLIEAVFMLVPILIALIDRDSDAAMGFVWTLAGTVIVSLPVYLLTRRASQEFYAQEGFVATGLSWIMLSVVGCLPFVISGEIPNLLDAFFETVSGFTTTGASILTNVEALSRPMLYWRSFSHWLGGMGVLVFLMALIPVASKTRNNSDIYLLRAESPGPEVGKLTPHMRSTALILYVLYIGLTVLCFIFLLFGGMPVFDSICTAFGTAGTGGFGIRNDSLASYSPFAQNVTTIFMFLFGVNFNMYYLVLLRRFGSILRNEELRAYIIYCVAAIATVAISTADNYASFGENLRHSAFQVVSIMTTTGFATVDTNLWPEIAKTALIVVMCVGACAGSTGGGMKVSRTVILAKSLRRNVRHALHPNRTVSLRMDGHPVSEQTIAAVGAYLVAYVIIVIVSFVIISLDNRSMETNMTAVLACFNNIGPGFGDVGATGNYAAFGALSKLTLCADMLLGRLEIFPLLVMLSRSTWNRNL